MLDNEYINYTLVFILIGILCVFFYHLIVLVKSGVESLSNGVSRLKPIGDGVENINNVINNNMENISSGVSNVSSILQGIERLINNVSNAFASKKEKREELKNE